jgi:hypothetical protein
MPTSGLTVFEESLPLIAGHSLVEQTLLGARVVEVVVTTSSPSVGHESAFVDEVPWSIARMLVTEGAILYDRKPRLNSDA